MREGKLTKSEATSQLIIVNYISLMKKIDFDKITVGYLCQQCQITRSTFYTYYRSIYDLIESIEAQLLSTLSLKKYHTFERSAPLTVPRNATKLWLQNCYDNKFYLISLLGEHGDPYFICKLRQSIKQGIEYEMDLDRISNDIFRPYFLQACTYLYLNVMHHWILSDTSISIDYVASLINAIRASSELIDYHIS